MVSAKEVNKAVVGAGLTGIELPLLLKVGNDCYHSGKRGKILPRQWFSSAEMLVEMLEKEDIGLYLDAVSSVKSDNGFVLNYPRVASRRIWSSIGTDQTLKLLTEPELK